MSDIDFDELDRAVASVLGGQESGHAAAAVAVSDAPAIAAAPVDTAPPVTTAPTTSAPEPITPVAAPAQALHAQPVKPVQRGRFLDMVHPSGDMAARTAVPVAPRPTPVTANGAFVSDVIATPAAPATAPVTVTPPVAPEPTSASDPTDFFAASPDDASPHKAPVSEPDAPSEPAVSPFIPDAKVEKRPLGAFTSADPLADVSLPTGDELHRQLAEVEGEDSVTSAFDTAGAPKATVAAAPVIVPTTPPAVSAAAPVTPIAAAPMATPAAVSAKKADTKPFTLSTRHDDRLPKPPKAGLEKVPKYGKGTLIWLTVAVAVVLIGFGVGASLYHYLF